MGLKQIHSLDHTVLLCSKFVETRAFYRDIMGFPVETDLERWVSFRVEGTLLTLRPRGTSGVFDDGRRVSGSAAV